MMQVRALTENDLRPALELAWEVFDEFESPDYAPEGIATFRSFIDYDSMSRKMRDGAIRFWGCFDGEELVGMVAVRQVVPAVTGDSCETGLSFHICLLFVRKEYHRQGVATRLFRRVAETYGNGQVRVIVTVNSSPYAVGFYHRLGFADTDREQVADGIRFTPMCMIWPG